MVELLWFCDSAVVALVVLVVIILLRTKYKRMVMRKVLKKKYQAELRNLRFWPEESGFKVTWWEDVGKGKHCPGLKVNHFDHSLKLLP